MSNDSGSAAALVANQTFRTQPGMVIVIKMKNTKTVVYATGEVGSVHLITPLRFSSEANFGGSLYGFTAKLIPKIAEGTNVSDLPEKLSDASKSKVQSFAELSLPQLASRPGNGKVFNVDAVINLDGQDYDIEIIFTKR